MSPIGATLIAFSLMGLLLLTGLPLVFALGGSAIVVGYLLMGPQVASVAYSSAYGVWREFVLVAVPLFVFMGAMLERSGIAEDLYSMIYNWSGGLRGGLAMGTVLICTIMASMTGISATACVTMGMVALPSMLRRGYNKELSMGCVMAGAALGVLIPPSVLFILFGLFADVSIGRLFAGGIFPGFMLSGLFILYIGIRSYLQPGLCPALPKDERPNWNKKLSSLKGTILPTLLIVIVLGSIFSGMATPTEAAAVGALGAAFCAIIARTLNWRVLKESSVDTVMVSGMSGWIIAAAFAFSAIYTATGGPELVKQTVAAIGLNKWIVLAIMQITFFVLGCFLDPGSIIMITVPVYLPLVKMFGFDPVWYGVVFVVNMEMAYLTPPFGFNLFYMKGVAPQEVTMEQIYRSVIPFVILEGLGLLLVIIFPQIALYLPSLFFGIAR